MSIFNSIGDVKIAKSDTDNLKVVVKLVQTKNLKDIDKKLNNLVIEPKIQNDVIFYEPLYANDTTYNYWEWLETNLNANGITINFDIEIPTTIKEVRVYNDIGDINLQNITAKIYTQTDIGNITGENLNPLDSAIFKVQIPSTDKTRLDAINIFPGTKRKTGIDVKFSNINNVNNITAGVESGKITLNLPLDASYTHEQAKLEDILYPFEISSKKQFKYYKEQSLQKFQPINNKYGRTVITTATDNNSSDDVLIK